jgi:hypothetical protein
MIKKLDEKFEKMCKKNKLNSKALTLGFIFFIVFWIVFESIIFGISLGFVMYVAFLDEDKKSKSNISKSKK